MMLDEMQRRDACIAAIERIPAAQRSPEQQDALGRMHAARDLQWRRLPLSYARAQLRQREIEAYAAQHRLALV